MENKLTKYLNTITVINLYRTEEMINKIKENDNSTKNAFSDIYKLVAETLT